MWQKLFCFFIILLFIIQCIPTRIKPEKLSNLKIVGGKETTPHAYPFMVSIYDEKKLRTICGGALITSKAVVTAAHCFKDVWFPKSRFLIRIGKHHMYMKEEGEELHHISEIKAHRDYSGDPFATKNDLAVVLLKSESKFRPISVDRNLSEPPAGTLLRLLGWGVSFESSKEPQPSLREVDLPIVDHEVCQNLHPDIKLDQNELCAGHLDPSIEKGSCHGDSGGPLFTLDDTVPKLVAIVSSGRGCARPNSPSFYTKIAPYLPWIESSIGPLQQ